MGSFSWYASDTKRAIRSVNTFPVYALRPDGEPLLETGYEGYGVFGGEDIYDLVADWNREYLSKHPEFCVFQSHQYWDEQQQGWVQAEAKRVDGFPWYPLYADLNKSRKDIAKGMLESGERSWEYRFIGIAIACGDNRNFQLLFPIKLVEVPVPYADATASKGDPGQGWGCRDRFEGDDPWMVDEDWDDDEEDI